MVHPNWLPSSDVMSMGTPKRDILPLGKFLATMGADMLEIGMVSVHLLQLKNRTILPTRKALRHAVDGLT